MTQPTFIMGNVSPPSAATIVNNSDVPGSTIADALDELQASESLEQTAVLIGGTDPDYHALVGQLVRCDISVDDQIVFLPTGATPAGARIGLKIVTPAGGNNAVFQVIGTLIDGDISLSLHGDYGCAILQSDGTNWMKLSVLGTFS